MLFKLHGFFFFFFYFLCWFIGADEHSFASLLCIILHSWLPILHLGVLQFSKPPMLSRLWTGPQMHLEQTSTGLNFFTLLAAILKSFGMLFREF